MKTLLGYLKSNQNKSGINNTYHIGLLQTKAYKALMGTTSGLLEKANISNSEWVALGIINDHSAGLRSLLLSEIMAVEQPFITVIVNKLGKQGLIKVSPDPTDKRAKIIHLSKEGKVFVKQTESNLSKELEKISAGISLADAIGYTKVLQAIVDYSEKPKQNLKKY